MYSSISWKCFGIVVFISGRRAAGKIVGIVIGVIVACIVLAVLVYCFCIKRRRQQQGGTVIRQTKGLCCNVLVLEQKYS